MAPPRIILLFGLTIGLFLGFVLDALFGPAAPLSLALPVGFYVLYLTVEASRRRP